MQDWPLPHRSSTVVSHNQKHQESASIECSITGIMDQGRYNWTKTPHSPNPQLEINDCPLSKFSADDARNCLKKKTVVFVGDSVTRYQYVNFVHMLEHGAYPSEVPCTTLDSSGVEKITDGDDDITTTTQQQENYVCNSFSNVNLWPNSAEYHFNTNLKLNNECCDCFKPQFDPKDIPKGTPSPKTMEHRVYQNDDYEITVVYIWFAKSFLPKADNWSGVKGHFMCPPFNGSYWCEAGYCEEQPEYMMDLDEALVKIVKPLQPNVLIMNAGLHRTTSDWPDHFWHSVASSAAEAVKDTNGVAFWRTTTASNSSRIHRWYDYKALATIPQYGVQILDYYAVTEQLGKNVENAYWDQWHFNDMVYGQLNNFVLNAVCPVERSELLLESSRKVI